MVTFWKSYTTFPGAHFSTPIIADGTVYFKLALGANHLIAVDAATGQRKWTYKAEGHYLTQPAVVGGSIYVGAGNGILHVLDAATGQEKWKLKTKGGEPVFADGVVYFADNDNLNAVDAATGTLKWRAWADGKA